MAEVRFTWNGGAGNETFERPLLVATVDGRSELEFDRKADGKKIVCAVPPHMATLLAPALASRSTITVYAVEAGTDGDKLRVKLSSVVIDSVPAV